MKAMKCILVCLSLSMVSCMSIEDTGLVRGGGGSGGSGGESGGSTGGDSGLEVIPVPSGAPRVSDAFGPPVAGWRLPQDFASEGLALIQDPDGYVVEAVGGAHVYNAAFNVYNLRGPLISGTDRNSYPISTILRRWGHAELFPDKDPRHNLRDAIVRHTDNGNYVIYGIGRVYYNTTPASSTRFNARQLLDGGTRLGFTETILVDKPEQHFTGFIHRSDLTREVTELGGGAYDSGQGSPFGLSYASRSMSGSWKWILEPPPFSSMDWTLRMPRPLGYSCAGGDSWVCIEPKVDNGVLRGVWSTERQAGGMVRFGSIAFALPTLGFGIRDYAYQSYTFGLGELDKAWGYFFKENPSTGLMEYWGYDGWPYSNNGEIVLGMALGRLRGVPGVLLFVTTGYAWQAGMYQDGPILQAFPVKYPY